MSYNNRVSVDAGADLRSFQWQAVQVDGTLATSAVDAVGIIANRANNGDDVGAIYSGRSKFRASGAIAAGARMAVASGGTFATVASGGISVGMNVGLAVTSGSIGPDGIFNFAGGVSQA